MSNPQNGPSVEEQRLADSDWQRWGTYLPERQWGTVREDDSPEGNPWAFTYDVVRYKACRWDEDGLLGWTDRQCRLCDSTSFWNGKDACLKESLCVLTNPLRNHGEDVTELYYYLDATPTHSYAQTRYKYPQVAFPYCALVQVNHRRCFDEGEFELLDTGALDEDRYFDCQIKYAKQLPDDILIRLTVINRSAKAAMLTILRTLYFRNMWDTKTPEATEAKKPSLQRAGTDQAISASHGTLGEFHFSLLTDGADLEATAPLLFAENPSNLAKLGLVPLSPNSSSKDAFHNFVVHGDSSGLCADDCGTKAAFVLNPTIDAGATFAHRVRLDEVGCAAHGMSHAEVDEVFNQLRREADAFYARKLPKDLTGEEVRIARQSYAGLLWSKQFYLYVGKEATAAYLACGCCRPCNTAKQPILIQLRRQASLPRQRTPLRQRRSLARSLFFIEYFWGDTG